MKISKGEHQSEEHPGYDDYFIFLLQQAKQFDLISPKGEHQPEKHPGCEREGAAGEHGDHPQALLEGQLLNFGNCSE